MSRSGVLFVTPSLPQTGGYQTFDQQTDSPVSWRERQLLQPLTEAAWARLIAARKAAAQ